MDRRAVLVVDDDAGMRDLVAAALRHSGWQTLTAAGGEEARCTARAAAPDVVVTDLRMPGMDGLELCRALRADDPDLPVVVLTAHGDLANAIEAMRAGAFDFLPKPFEPDELRLRVERAVAQRALTDEVRRLRRVVAERGRFGRLLGAGPAMQRLFSLLDQITDSDASVLLTGETGTGKELVARTLHERSRRGGHAFVAVNCAAMPEALLESELFGHVRGAFTDARTARPGLLAAAEGGTLFFDEVGELPVLLQPKLLRALQERTFRPVGGDREVSFDARVISATNLDLAQAVVDRSFRDDLYFRLNVIEVAVPPLRARGGDVLALAREFLEELCARAGRRPMELAPEAREALLGYGWPGNVRELRNMVERAVALARDEVVTAADLPPRVRQPAAECGRPEEPDEPLALEEVERRHVLASLRRCDGNKSQAADLLQIDRRTLYRKLERWGVT